MNMMRVSRSGFTSSRQPGTEEHLRGNAMGLARSSPLALLGAVLSAVLFFSLSALAQINPQDLPSSPYSFPASTPRQSAWYTRDAARALELHAASTNAAVQTALQEIREMRDKLLVTETNAWDRDPLLLICDRFIERTHEWVMEKHRDEYQMSLTWFYSTNDQATVASRQRLARDLSDMMSLVIFKELDSNTNFAALQETCFEMIRDLMEKTANSAKPDGVFRYWYFDRYIGYPTNPPSLDYSYTNLQTQISRRYDLLTSGIGKIQKEKEIPPEAIAGLKYGDLYRSLDGMCEMYLDARTPPELHKLREDLRSKLINLSWLEK
jgi:hypothetical protein